MTDKEIAGMESAASGDSVSIRLQKPRQAVRSQSIVCPRLGFGSIGKAASVPYQSREIRWFFR